MLLLERAETVAARVRRLMGTVRNEDDDENSFACLKEANNHLMQSVNRSIDLLDSQPIEW
jgi:hypothetical protein